MFKKSIIASLLAASCISAVAVDYYIVVPVSGRTSPAVVTLAGASLPEGTVLTPYTFDLGPSLQVTGDSSFTPTGVTWSVGSSALPAGLSLGATGVIAGTPSLSASSTFEVVATYKTKAGSQVYSIVVKDLIQALNLTVAAGTKNYVIATAAGSPTQPKAITVTVPSGVVVGSSNSDAAIFTGNLPAGSTVHLINQGTIQGSGGRGGTGGGYNGGLSAGNPGNPAIRIRGVAATVDNTAGNIYAGGGGGGGGGGNPCGGMGGGGGGGTGSIVGSGGTGGYTSGLGFAGAGVAGTTTTGGSGGGGAYDGARGGQGGAPGTAGSNGLTGANCNGFGYQGAPGGLAGYAVSLEASGTISWVGGFNTTQVKGR